MASDPYKYFRIEGRQLLEELGRGALELEHGLAPEVVAKLLRLAHTLKGAARVVKQAEIAKLAHNAEDLLAPLKTAAASRDQIDRLLGMLDRIGGSLSALEPTTPAAQLPAEAETLPKPVAQPGELDDLLAGLSEALVQVQAMRQRGAEAVQAKQAAEALSNQHATADDRARGAAEDLRVQLAHLEERLVRGVDQLQRELRQALDAAERFRLLPASSIFVTLERISRDAARAAGKELVFRASGGEIRIEGAVLIKVQRALVQLVRNAVAHGIEDPEARRHCGKNARGAVDVRVERRGGQVVFACRDDGRGIDFGAVRERARKSGLIAADVDPTRVELSAILLEGGLSTSAEVTELSGRGVGLDVVREELRNLGGRVRLSSDDGLGTAFELTVPVSSTTLEALLVEAAGQTVALPLEVARRAFRVSAGDVSRVGSDGRQVVTERGLAMPLISLPALLDSRAHHSLSPAAVVVATNGTTFALGVDRVLGNASVVLRPLPQLAPLNPIAAGVFLDDSGNPRLVLDESRLEAAAQRGALQAPAVAERRPILVIDDSVTTRMLEQSILESAGYEVSLAASAEEGLEMARARNYGLYLVDVEMPGMDGFGFVQRTRGDALLRDTPAILVTSRNAPEDRQRGRDVGAFSYIVKSAFDQRELLEIVRRTVG